jgi:hypothetical protein
MLLFEKVFSLPEKGPITESTAPAMAPFLFSLGCAIQTHRPVNNIGLGPAVMNDSVAL